MQIDGPLALPAKQNRACKSGLKKTDRINQGGADPYGGRGEASQAEATSATLFAAHFNECIG